MKATDNSSGTDNPSGAQGGRARPANTQVTGPRALGVKANPQPSSATKAVDPKSPAKKASNQTANSKKAKNQTSADTYRSEARKETTAAVNKPEDGSRLNATELHRNTARPSVESVVALVRAWLDESENHKVSQDNARLAEVLKDPVGLDFALGFIDGVIRPEDIGIAGKRFGEVSKLTPKSLPWYLKAAVRSGGAIAPGYPWLTVPPARKALRGLIGHLLLDATAEKLGPALTQLRANGNRLNINLLGEAVLGELEADRRLNDIQELLVRDDVDYISVKVSNVVSQLSAWSFDENVDRVVRKLTPLYAEAARLSAAGTPKFINLDMEEYHDLELTLAVFMRLLEQNQLQHYSAGIVLQAYLPDALSAMQKLNRWATKRITIGGAPIKVRLVKGANLDMERVDATMHGWSLATYATKQETDTNYKRVLDWAMTPDRLAAVKLGIAGHNLFDIAYAWLMSKERRVESEINFEMLLGMAPGHAEAIRKEVGPLVTYTPVVHPDEFDAGISYLVRRLTENASQENFMSAAFQLGTNERIFIRELARFQRSLDALEADIVPPPANRRQNRAYEWRGNARKAALKNLPQTGANKTDHDPGLTGVVLGIKRGSTGIVKSPETFSNEPNTDPAVTANREWGRDILERVSSASKHSGLGIASIKEALISSRHDLDELMGSVAAAGASWGTKTGASRASLLHRVGIELAAAREQLIEIMAEEAGKTIAEADSEVSEAVDFAHYYAERARELDQVQGAKFVPAKLTVVVPPWNFPVAIPAGGILAALAAGSGVILKPAKLSQRTGAVLAEILWDAGIPRELLALVSLATNELGAKLVADSLVDRVILTGSYATAELFRSFRKDLPLLAETSGKNAIVVTPSADIDLAVTDIVRSAFGHAGQKCSAASLVILVGSMARSKRFQRQLIDAATSLRVGLAGDPRSQMGPLIEPAKGKLLSALTELGHGEEWLVEPRKLDGAGQLWTPGIKAGVAPGSSFHLTEVFGPVLGVMHAKSLSEAISLQNAVEFGLTAGIQSLDPVEINQWVAEVQAGNLYVNREITGAIVQRQPFGGWKHSAVGAGAKVGGPNYLFGLGGWRAVKGRKSETLHLRGIGRRVTELIEAAQGSLSYEDFDELRRAALSDQIAWSKEYSTVKDVTNLGVERNLLRYLPVPVAIRVGSNVHLVDSLRLLAAALRSGATFNISTWHELPSRVLTLLAALDIKVRREHDEDFIARVRDTGIAALSANRVRLAGGSHEALAKALDGTPEVAIWSHEVTGSGRVELLPFLREQAVSITNHRFGRITNIADGII